MDNCAQANALVDTGATRSCVSQRIADKLKVAPIDKKHVQTAGGVFPKNVYRINFHIPIYYKASSTQGAVNIKSIYQIDVTQADLPDSCDILLGMDVIMEGSLHVSGGQFTFCT